MHAFCGDIRDLELKSITSFISNPPFGFHLKHFNEEIIDFQVRNEIKLAYVLHSVNSYEYIYGYSKSKKIKMEILNFFSFPIPRIFSFHKQDLACVGVYLVKQTFLGAAANQDSVAFLDVKVMDDSFVDINPCRGPFGVDCIDGIQISETEREAINQKFNRILDRELNEVKLPRLVDCVDVTLNITSNDIVELLEHHYETYKEFYKLDKEKPISLMANKLGMKYDLERKVKTSGNPNKLIRIGQHGSLEAMLRTYTQIYSLEKAKFDALPVLERRAGKKLILNKSKSIGWIKKFRRHNMTLKGLEKEDQEYDQCVEDSSDVRDEVIISRIREIDPSLAENIGRDNFVNKENTKKNIMSLSQYGMLLNSYEEHQEKWINNLDCIMAALYILKRQYKIVLDNLEKVDDSKLDLKNQKSPGFPYNMVRGAVNVNFKEEIKKTFEEMQEWNREGILFYIYYNAFTKMDLMKKDKKDILRIISSSSAHYSLLSQRYLKSLDELLRKYHRRFEMRIGISNFYKEYESVYKYLTSIEDPLFGESDVTGWDFHIFTWLIELFYFFLIKEGAWELSDLDQFYLAQVIEGHVSGHFITREGELVQIIGGQKSGHQATCSLNSFIHVFILNFAFCLFLKRKNEIIIEKENYNTIFEKWWLNFKFVLLSDDENHSISRSFYNRGFNGKFLTEIWMDYFSQLIKPNKNVFGKESLFADIKFLSNRYLKLPEGHIVPYPETARVLDSVCFFRDRAKITAQLSAFVKDKDRVMEILRLARINALYIMGFFNEDLNKVLSRLRDISLEKLGFTITSFEKRSEIVASLKTELVSYIRHSSDLYDRTIGLFYYILNNLMNQGGDENLELSRVWHPSTIYSLYLTDVRLHKIRNLNSLKMVFEDQIKDYCGEGVALVSPKPDGFKSSVLYGILKTLGKQVVKYEGHLIREKIKILAESYDHIFIGENRAVNLVELYYNTDIELFSKLVFPFADFYYSEIASLVEVYGGRLELFSERNLFSSYFNNVDVYNSNVCVKSINYSASVRVPIVANSKNDCVLLHFPWQQLSEDQLNRALLNYEKVHIFQLEVKLMVRVGDFYLVDRDGMLYMFRLNQNENKKMFVQYDKYAGFDKKLWYCGGLDEKNIDCFNKNSKCNSYFKLTTIVKPLCQRQLSQAEINPCRERLSVQSYGCANIDIEPLDKWFKRFYQENYLLVQDPKDNNLMGNKQVDEKILLFYRNNKFVKQLVQGKKVNKILMDKAPEIIGYSYMPEFRRCFQNSFSIVTGPPGSGKTTLIARLIYNFISEKTLVVATTNQAIRNVSEKLDDLNVRYYRYRAKTVRDCVGKSETVQFGTSDVVLATPAKCVSIGIGPMQNLIVDEGGLMALSYWPVFLRTEFKRIIVIGDPQQRSPFPLNIIKDSIWSNSIYALYKEDLILKFNYRLPVMYCEFVSQFYTEKLICKTNKKGFFKEIIYEGGAKESEKSAVNEDSYKQYPKADVYLTPYLAHAEFLIGKGLNAHTIDSFQGSEADIVVLDFCVDKPSSFVLDHQRINVAFSRVKEGMYILWTQPIRDEFLLKFNCKSLLA